MAAGVRLSEDVRNGVAALRTAAEKAGLHAQPVAARFAKTWPRGRADEVLVVVVGPDGLLMSRSKVVGPIDLDDLRLRLAGAEAAVETLTAVSPRSHAPALTARESALLDAGGLTADAPEGLDAFDRSRIEYEVLLHDSLLLDEAARELGVTPSRLRQRLQGTRRTLYGVKDGRGWRIPRFQFARRGKLIRGIEQVIPRLRTDAHPLAVARWFSSPHQDLVGGAKDMPVTPLAWLSAGHDVETVAQLAQEI